MSNPEPMDEPDRNAFDRVLNDSLQAIEIELSSASRGRMWQHLLLVLEANRQFNLTRITDVADAAVKHYADSLTLLNVPWVDPSAEHRILDVGTGAGFPAVPLAIACPNWQITAIDSRTKKAQFVAEAARDLDLGNLSAKTARAGTMSIAAAERYEVVLLRAVSKIGDGLKEIRRLVAPGGLVIFYKTVHITPEEIKLGQKACERFGFEPAGEHNVTLPTPDEPLRRRFMAYRLTGS